MLTSRLKLLVREDVLARDDDGAGNVEYRLTGKGIELWPVVRVVMGWGDAHYSPGGVKRALFHDQDGGSLDHEGRCRECGSAVAVDETRIEPGPGFDATDANPDPVSALLNVPRRLLEPIPATRAAQGGQAG